MSFDNKLEKYFNNYINQLKMLLDRFKHLKLKNIEVKLYKENGDILDIDEVIKMFEDYLQEALGIQNNKKEK